VVETGGLENRCTGNRTGGSNPSPSATQSGCRETLLHSSENRAKSPQFRGFCFQAGPEKVSHFTREAGFVAFFSDEPIGSPISTTPSGESNAITNR
jgi:hypothetical protein